MLLCCYVPSCGNISVRTQMHHMLNCGNVPETTNHTDPIFCRPAQGQKGTSNPLNVVTHYRGRAYDAALRANLVLDIAADKEHVHAVVVPPMAAPGTSRPATCQPGI